MSGSQPTVMSFGADVAGLIPGVSLNVLGQIDCWFQTDHRTDLCYIQQCMLTLKKTGCFSIRVIPQKTSLAHDNVECRSLFKESANNTPQPQESANLRRRR